ncbi:Chordin [Acropora cervicornis]|uniref:Chordin n=1 Tax=Acropora cervicornis TaxID=6130 RepID=A0AAD9PS70_ACRCE|nr:Chordin [Acropora cervicornis]
MLLISPKVRLFITIHFVKGSGTKATIQFIKNPSPNKAQRTVKVINTNDIKRENTNFKVLWLNPAEHSLKWMSRGHLNITVLLRTDDQSVQLTGRIAIKRTCNSIVSPLSGQDAPRPTMTGASGYASFEIDHKGQVYYKIFLSGLLNQVEEITLQATSNRHVVKRLTRLVSVDDYGRAKILGVWERPSFAQTCWLFNGNMFVNVRTALNKNAEIHGKLKQFPYKGHQLSYQEPPLLLSGNEVVPKIQTGAAGQAWFLLDKHCALHYHLILSGINRGSKNLLTAELQGFADFGEVPQPYDEHVHLLRKFEGEMVSGIARNLGPEFLRNLIQGLVYVQVSSEDAPQGELRSQDEEIVCSVVKCQRLNCSEAPIMVPHSCCPVCPDNEDGNSESIKKSLSNKKDCSFSGSKFKDGQTWQPHFPLIGLSRCLTCTCSDGRTTCKRNVCPKGFCQNSIDSTMTNCCVPCPGS